MTASPTEPSLLGQLHRVVLDREPPSSDLLRALDEDPFLLQHAYRFALDIATLEAAAGGAGGASERIEALLAAAAERAAKRDARPMPGAARSLTVRQRWIRWGALAAVLGLLCTVSLRLTLGGVVASAPVSFRVRDNSSLGTHAMHGSAGFVLDADDTLEVLLPSSGDAHYAYLIWRHAGRTIRHEAALDGDGQFVGLRGAAARRDSEGLHLTLPIRHLPVGSDIALHIAFGTRAADEEELEAIAQARSVRSRALSGVAHLPPVRVEAAKP